MLAPLLRKCVVVFIDDILIYSKTWTDHLSHIRVVFPILDSQQFKVKLSKRSFAQTSLYYLGHVISKDGVATDPSKLTMVKTWPTPRTVRDVRKTEDSNMEERPKRITKPNMRLTGPNWTR
jgi:hypothetical protein